MKTQRTSRLAKGRRATVAETNERETPFPDIPSVPCAMEDLQCALQRAEQDNRTYLVAHYRERLRRVDEFFL